MAVATKDHLQPLPAHINAEYLQPPFVVAEYQRRWGMAGGIGAIITIIGAVWSYKTGDFLHIQHFWRAYLVGFMFCVGMTAGSMALLMLQHVTGGKWGLVLRRILEAGTRTWWFSFALFLGLAFFGAKYLYPWSTLPEISNTIGAHAHESLASRGSYATLHWWTIRGVLIFLGWGVFIWFFNRWSPMQDEPPRSWEWANRLRIRFMRLGGAGVLFYALTITLASVDWTMSLDAVWYSTIWGMMYMVGQTMAGLCLAIITLVMLAKYEPLSTLLRKTELHDVGKLLLAWVMLYTYLSWDQFIIIWSGNLPEEIRWYIPRVRGGWMPVFLFLAIFHFVVPFLLLLNRNLKKHGPRLMRVAVLLMVARLVDLYWHIVPAFRDENVLSGVPGAGFHPTWLDVVVPVSMICLWLGLFLGELRKRPILIAYHPSFHEILEPSHGAH